ncbi:hypothetical protein HDU84_008113 [Entophlyctis sp. JEL0112]|nr:hypothetical protein HDU84_008113 [Entophlyctis sp. JEL0112]
MSSVAAPFTASVPFDFSAVDSADSAVPAVVPAPANPNPSRGRAGGRHLATDEPVSKKIHQQRLSSRAYRERKEKYVKDLEATVAELSQSAKISESLAQRIRHLEAENIMLRNLAAPFMAQPPLVVPAVETSPSDSSSVGTHGGAVGGVPASVASTSVLPDPFLPPPVVGAASFMDTHANIDFTAVLRILEDPTAFEALLNSQLPTLPTDEQIINPHFIGVRDALMAVPSLANELGLVAELVALYVAFTDYNTEVKNPHICRVTFASIQSLQGKIIEKCQNNLQDSRRVMRIFHEVKSRYAIIDDYSIL